MAEKLDPTRPPPPDTVRFVVTLNGTSENPYLRLGLRQNPFPQVGRMEYSRVNHSLARLAAEPMPTVDDLRRVLRELGSTDEFRALCLTQYRPGEVVEFEIYIPQ
jgi:hypothetical protein